jgi:hypothetical protein
MGFAYLSGGGGGGAGLGGAIFTFTRSNGIADSQVILTDCTLVSNGAEGGAGGSGEYGNPGSGGDAFGGAIFDLDGLLTLHDDTVDSNVVIPGPGANGASAGMPNARPADGGAVYILAFGNTFDSGDATGASCVLFNSILADSTGGRDLVVQEINGHGTNLAGVQGGTNLVESSDAIHPATIAFSGTEYIGKPDLGPLQDYGGNHIWTMAVKPSPTNQAFGTGNASDPGVAGTTDERGLARLDPTRPAGKNLDLGAFEWNLGDPTMIIPITPPSQGTQGYVIVLVAIKQGKPGRHGHGHVRQKLTLGNTSGSAWVGPVWLAFDGLDPGIMVRDAAGGTAAPGPLGSTALEVVPAGGVWLPGQSLSVVLEFIIPRGKHLHFTPRVLAEPGTP